MSFYQLVEPLFTSKIHKLAQKHHGPERAQGLSTRVSAAWRLVESLLSNNPASREATDVDERVRILNGCIIPRLERITNGFNQDLIRLSASPNHQAEAAAVMEERGRQMAQIELMMIMLLNSKMYSKQFWASLVRWQMYTYQENCIRLMEDYKEMTRHVSGDRCDVETILSALSTAVRRACEQPEPSPEKTTFGDAFAIRNIYDDPGLKALVESNMFTPQRQRELYEAAEEMMYQQPAFPPECYALLSNPNNISQLSVSG